MLFISSSPEDTEKIGECLGSIIDKGYLITLIGDLGAGKTEFVKGLARGMGIDEYITSPTFTIVNEYKGNIPLYHFDVYRINDTDEMYEIGYEEYFYGEGVSVIEWANLIEDILPQDRIDIEISKDLELGDNSRNITIKTKGQAYDNLLSDLLLKCDFS